MGTIPSQNQILVLHSQRARLQEQIKEVQNVMRKIREQEINVSSTVYCHLGGAYIKKKPRELYPALEG